MQRAVEEVLAEGEEVDEKAATLTGFPHDRVLLDDEEQEDDSEELLKPPGGVENAKEGVPKKRVVVVEMDPEQITDDMKAYVVEVDDDEKVHVPDHIGRRSSRSSGSGRPSRSAGSATTRSTLLQ